MKLSPAQIKTLQALHRDVCSKDELDHHFTDGHAADELVAAGLARVHASFYSITVKGREALAVARREAAIPKLNQPVVAYESKKADTISITPPLDITELSAPQSGLFKAPVINSEVKQKKGESMNALVDTGITHTLKDIVDVVILRNQIHKSEIYAMFPMLDTNKKSKVQKDVFYLKAQQVLLENADGELRVGSNCNKWLEKLNKKASKADKPKAVPEFKLVDSTELTEGGTPAEVVATESVVESPDLEMHIPAFLRKDKSSLPELVETIHAAPTAEAIVFPAPSADLNFEDAHAIIDAELVFQYMPESDAVDTFEQARTETRQEILKHLGSSVRFALTSDKTLMLMGLDHPVELNKTDTEKLIEFCEEISMTLVCEVESPEIAKHQAVLELCQSLMQFDPIELHAQIQAKALDAVTKMQGLKG